MITGYPVTKTGITAAVGLIQHYLLRHKFLFVLSSENFWPFYFVPTSNFPLELRCAAGIGDSNWSGQLLFSRVLFLFWASERLEAQAAEHTFKSGPLLQRAIQPRAANVCTSAQVRTIFSIKMTQLCPGSFQSLFRNSILKHIQEILFTLFMAIFAVQ